MALRVACLALVDISSAPLVLYALGRLEGLFHSAVLVWFVGFGVAGRGPLPYSAPAPRYVAAVYIIKCELVDAVSLLSSYVGCRWWKGRTLPGSPEVRELELGCGGYAPGGLLCPGCSMAALAAAGNLVGIHRLFPRARHGLGVHADPGSGAVSPGISA